MRRRQGKIITLSATPILLSLSQFGKGSKTIQIVYCYAYYQRLVGQQDRRRGLHLLGAHYLGRHRGLHWLGAHYRTVLYLPPPLSISFLAAIAAIPAIAPFANGLLNILP